MNTRELCLETYMLNLSLLTVNEKQQDMGIRSFLFVVSIILSAAPVSLSFCRYSKHEVSTAFCFGSNAMFPYF